MWRGFVSIASVNSVSEQLPAVTFSGPEEADSSMR